MVPNIDNETLRTLVKESKKSKSIGIATFVVSFASLVILIMTLIVILYK